LAEAENDVDFPSKKMLEDFNPPELYGGSDPAKKVAFSFE